MTLRGLDWSRDGDDWPNRAASRFVQAGGLSWHVQILGHGPVMLLVHGTAASTHSWRTLLPMLAQRWTVVAMDLPSHAFTSAPSSRDLSLEGMSRLIDQLLQALNVRPDYAVGHSAGVAILARMCLNGSIAPKSLVSLNGALLPFEGVPNVLFPALAGILFSNPLTAFVVSSSASPHRVEKLLRETGSVVDAEGLKLYARLFANPRHISGALGMMANWQLAGMEAALAHLKPKLLLAAGANDRSIPPQQARHLASVVPNAQFALMNGLGHLAHEEAASVAQSLIEEFITRTATCPLEGGSETAVQSRT